MKIITFITVFILTAFQTFSQDLIWAKGTTDTSGHRLARSLSVSSSGNVYIVGRYSSTSDFDPGPGIFNVTSNGYSDIFILCLDSAGNFCWVKSMGGGGNDEANSIDIDDSNNIIVTGEFTNAVDFDPGPGVTILSGTSFILKLDNFGNFLWAKSIDGAESYSISTDGSGNIYSTGAYQGIVDFDPGIDTANFIDYGAARAIYFLKLDPIGNYLWAKVVAGSVWSNNSGRSIVTDSVGNFYASGFFHDTLDLDPDTSVSLVSSITNFDQYFAKFDPDGNLTWAFSLDGVGTSVSGAVGSGDDIVLDNSGNFYITGCFRDSVDFDPGLNSNPLISFGSQDDIYVAKFTINGQFLWAKKLGGIGPDKGFSVAVDSKLNVITIGDYSYTCDFDPGPGIYNLTSTPTASADPFISILDSSGNFVGAKRISGNKNGYANSAAFSAFDELFICGHFFDTLLFDSTLAIYSNGANAFAAKYGTVATGLNENIFNATIQAFPNPTEGTVYLDFGKSSSNVTISVINELGMTLKEYSYKNSRQERLDLHYSPGVYFLKIQTVESVIIKQIILF